MGREGTIALILAQLEFDASQLSECPFPQPPGQGL